ncbi:MAG TPA: hypothetical protein VEX43_19230 [Chthoniobacterales bacterium]|nr:hypothetical protein [Chthoniobacterales bacterium]
MATALLAVFLLARPATAAAKVLEESIEQKYSLDPDATLSIANTDGSIRIYAAETTEILIQATKKAYTAERLRGIVVDVQATRKTVTIGTTFPPRKNALSDRSGTVDYIVIVPQAIKITQLDLVNGEATVEGLRGGGAKVRVTNGWISAQDCFADLDLTVETGRLDVFYGWWENHKFSVKGSSDRGIVRAFLPSDASVMLNATSATGRIINALAAQKTGANDTVRSLNTVLGSNAEAVIELKAGTGDIQIHKSY